MNDSMTRRQMLAVLGATALLPGVAFTQTTRRKHVLHIPIDDLRCTLGCYGDPHALTPNIDGLAARGCMFERAYVQQAVCAASRASVLTGTRPATTGVTYPYNDRFVDEIVKQHPTFPTWFERQGAWSRMLGKIHHERARAIEEVDAAPDVGWIEGRSWQDYADPENNRLSHENNAPPWEAIDVDDDAYRDGRQTTQAIGLLREYDQQRPDEPMFLSLGYRKPHGPMALRRVAREWRFHRARAVRPRHRSGRTHQRRG